MANEDISPSEDERVVLEQNLLRVEECFVYTIPPMKSSGGHRADDWNLANPLATCSLNLTRLDSTLLINILSSRPKHDGPKGATENFLFAQSKIKYDENQNMEHWVENVVDSSRYFVVRISDERKKREAHIGLGFRERNDATDFKMGLMEYVKAMKREKMAEEIHKTHEHLDGNNPSDSESNGLPLPPLPAVSKLTLKEGEKIHISLPNVEREGKHRSSPKTHEKVVGKGGLLLKKPRAATTPALLPKPETELVKETKLEISDEKNDDDDEWGDFESSG